MVRAWRPDTEVCAGLLLGAGLGGFFDGIVFHQVLQWHHMLSSRVPPTTLVNVEVNMFWDGIFHASVWVMTAAGSLMVWRSSGRRNPPRSGRTVLGSCMAGWGLFNLVEGLVDHQLLDLHHVCEFSGHRLAWDLGYLALGAAMLAGGWRIAAAGGHPVAREIRR